MKLIAFFLWLIVVLLAFIIHPLLAILIVGISGISFFIHALVTGPAWLDKLEGVERDEDGFIRGSGG